MNEDLKNKCQKLIRQKLREIEHLLKTAESDKCDHYVQEWSEYHEDLFCAVCDARIQDD